MSQDKEVWTPDEEDFLIKNYPTKGLKWCAERLPGRTRYAIRSQVSLLGITKLYGSSPLGKVWTSEEDALLHEHHEQGHRACAALLPDRSLLAVKERLWRLGLSLPRKKVWDFGPVAEDLYMTGLNSGEIAALIGRSVTQVEAYVSYHSLREVREWRRQYEAEEILERHGLLKTEDKAA